MRGRPSDLVAWLFEQPKDKVFEVKEYREKRSLDANSYYWVLVGKIAEVMNLSADEIHRRMMNDYGSWEYEEDGSPKWVIFPKSKPLPRNGYYFDTGADVTVKGAKSGEETGHAYIVIKGSHEYNSKEMARLIDGVVQECKQLDIETRTPAEIEQMIKLMEEGNNDRK